MKYRITIEEERTTALQPSVNREATRDMYTTDRVETDNKEVAAAFLRGVADRIDPPQKHHRG